MDLDGTTLTNNATISSLTKKTIKEATRQGHIVSIVTGRPNRISINFYKELGLKTPMINFNGNLGILPDKKWQLEYQHTIDREIVFDLVSKSKSLGISVIAAENRKTFLINQGAKFETGFFPTILETNQILNQKNLTYNPICISLSVNPLQKNNVINYINQNYGDLVEISPWGGKYPIIELATKGIKKSTGVKILADFYGIMQKDIVAFGDESNDTSMIEFAGKGVAMKNAIPEIKKIANDVTEFTNDEDGVAKYIQRFL